MTVIFARADLNKFNYKIILLQMLRNRNAMERTKNMGNCNEREKES